MRVSAHEWVERRISAYTDAAGTDAVRSARARLKPAAADGAATEAFCESRCPLHAAYHETFSSK